MRTDDRLENDGRAAEMARADRPATQSGACEPDAAGIALEKLQFEQTC